MATKKGAADTAKDSGIADPAAATEMDSAAGAIIEPAIADAVDLTHESVDANPRAGTTAEQNSTDWNDAKRRTPQDADFAGQGLDRSVYGLTDDAGGAD
ncbi:MAG: hypothetical protein Q4G36_08240 [Paracoccus sp. (in: a-proteobacteria)]|nr:hypothetical protein [Paracoccus sp. (in: a-proteobacteria)]